MVIDALKFRAGGNFIEFKRVLVNSPVVKFKFSLGYSYDHR